MMYLGVSLSFMDGGLACRLVSLLVGVWEGSFAVVVLVGVSSYFLHIPFYPIVFFIRAYFWLLFVIGVLDVLI
jgi:hypothetical protein